MPRPKKNVDEEKESKYIWQPHPGAQIPPLQSLEDIENIESI